MLCCALPSVHSLNMNSFCSMHSLISLLFRRRVEGSSSTAESVQLKQELRIITSEIDKEEARAARDELTDCERNIRGLNVSSAGPNTSTAGPNTSQAGLSRPCATKNMQQSHTGGATVALSGVTVAMDVRVVFNIKER